MLVLRCYQGDVGGGYYMDDNALPLRMLLLWEAVLYGIRTTARAFPAIEK